MRRWLLALVPVLMLLLLPVARAAYGAQESAPAEGPQAQTFGIQPAGATEPDSRGTFSYAATPGAVVKDHVAVWNYSDQPLTLRLYPADAFNTDSGGYDVLPEGRPSGAAGTWLKAAADSLTLPARSRQIVPFTLAVPADATPGTTRRASWWRCGRRARTPRATPSPSTSGSAPGSTSGWRGRCGPS